MNLQPNNFFVRRGFLIRRRGSSLSLYIYIYIYVVPSVSFQTFFAQAFRIVIDLWKFTVIAIYLMRWLTNFYDFPFKWTATAAIGIHPTKAWLWFSKMQSGREDTLEERYAINSVLNLEKMSRKAYRNFRLLFDHLAWIEHQFLSGIRDSRKAGGLWGMMKCAGGVRKSIHHSWLAKQLGFGLLCWGFKGVQEEIPSEESSTL